MGTGLLDDQSFEFIKPVRHAYRWRTGRDEQPSPSPAERWRVVIPPWIRGSCERTCFIGGGLHCLQEATATEIVE